MPAASSYLEAQLGGPGRRDTAMILYEGWAEKESRYLGRWRSRWLVLFKDQHSRLPALCTFKEARCDWDQSTYPVATERIVLVGASCIAFPSWHYGVREHVFHLQARSGDFFFSTGTSADAAGWARSVGQSIAEAALRLGGISIADDQTEGRDSVGSPDSSSTAADWLHPISSSSSGGGSTPCCNADPELQGGTIDDGSGVGIRGRSEGIGFTPAACVRPAAVLSTPITAGNVNGVPELAGPSPSSRQQRQRQQSPRKRSVSWGGTTDEPMGAGSSNVSRAMTAAIAGAAAAAEAEAEVQAAHKATEQAKLAAAGAAAVAAVTPRSDAVTEGGSAAPCTSIGTCTPTPSVAESSPEAQALAAENRVLATQVRRLKQTLEEVAIAELENELESLDMQEADLEDELANAREAMEEAMEQSEEQSEEQAVRRSAVADGVASRAVATALRVANGNGEHEAAATGPDRAETVAGSTNGHTNGDTVDGSGGAADEDESLVAASNTVAEIEQALVTLRLRQHFCKDQIEQLSSGAPAAIRTHSSSSLGSEVGGSPRSSFSETQRATTPGGRESGASDAEEDGYVPFAV